jgi:hypothetical protein
MGQRHRVGVAVRLELADAGEAGAQPDFEAGQLVGLQLFRGAGDDRLDRRVVAPKIRAAQRAGADHFHVLFLVVFF